MTGFHIVSAHENEILKLQDEKCVTNLQVIEHSECRHARGRRTKQRLQDRCCTLLVLLLTGQRRRLRGLRTRPQC